LRELTMKEKQWQNLIVSGVYAVIFVLVVVI
jgi:hypothetical protein